MRSYRLRMRDDQCYETQTIEARDLADARRQADAETQDWIDRGEWGIDGARISAYWTLTNSRGVESATGWVTVEIEPDHDALIRAAGGDTDCDHDWSSKGEGGCRDNPGVWFTGGTSIVFATHCRKCGLHRVERRTGEQRNPGEHDTVTYEQPDTWCAACAQVECRCG